MTNFIKFGGYCACGGPEIVGVEPAATLLATHQEDGVRPPPPFVILAVLKVILNFVFGPPLPPGGPGGGSGLSYP